MSIFSQESSLAPLTKGFLMSSLSVSAKEFSELVQRVKRLEDIVLEQEDKVQELMIRTGAIAYDEFESSTLSPPSGPNAIAAPSPLITPDARKVISQINRLSFFQKYEEIQTVVLKALEANRLNDESKGTLMHRLAWAFYNVRKIKEAKEQVLEALKLKLSTDLQKRFSSLTRKINENDAESASKKTVSSNKTPKKRKRA